MTAVGMVGVEGVFLNLRVETGRHLWGIGVETTHHCNHPNRFWGKHGGYLSLPGSVSRRGGASLPKKTRLQNRRTCFIEGSGSILGTQYSASRITSRAGSTGLTRPSLPPTRAHGIRLRQPTLTSENLEENRPSGDQSQQGNRSSDVDSKIPHPCGGSTIVIDTREQRPWSFTLPTVVRGLSVGDYSIEGHETEVAIERKSLSDFVGSVTAGRARFWRELEKLAAYRLRAVVVEASVADVLAAAYRSKAAPWSILTSALAITVDFGIPVVWGHNAVCAARCAEWMLLRATKRSAKEATNAA